MKIDFEKALSGKVETLSEAAKVMADFVTPDEDLQRLITYAVKTPEEESRLLFILTIIAHVRNKGNNEMQRLIQKQVEDITKEIQPA